MMMYGKCPFVQSDTSGQLARLGKRDVGSRESILGNQNQLDPQTQSQFTPSTRTMP